MPENSKKSTEKDTLQTVKKTEEPAKDKTLHNVTKPENKPKNKSREIVILALLLLFVTGGSLLFVAAAGGWFSEQKTTLSEEYYCKDTPCNIDPEELTVEKFNDLVGAKKSFLVIIDKGGCTTADRLKTFAKDFAESEKVKFYKMDFADMKETSMKEKIRFYPSLAVIKNGEVASFLRADSDDDSDAYNNYEAFKSWLKRFVSI